MKIKSQRLLRAIFASRGNLTRGYCASARKSGDVEISAFKDGCPAAVSISADFELAWAWRARSESEYVRKAATERENIPFLLQSLEQFQVPITWATVGHLFLSSCEQGTCGRAHPQLPRPPRNTRWTGDWYRHDPCSNFKKDPHWYAPDLITQILRSPVRHELGTHSFSHIDFSPDTSTHELVSEEIRACIDAMEPFATRPKSLVFCHNRMGHQYADLLYDLGITAVRHRDQRIRLSYPRRTEAGVYWIYESMNLRLARYYRYEEKARILMDEAIRRGAAYHIWFHPSDEREVFEEAFLPILQQIAELRESGIVWVATMGDLAAYCEARHQTVLKTQRNSDGLLIELESKLNTARFGNPDLTLEISADHPVTKVVVDEDTIARDVPTRMSNAVGGKRRVLVNVPSQSRRVSVFFDQASTVCAA